MRLAPDQLQVPTNRASGALPAGGGGRRGPGAMSPTQIRAWAGSAGRLLNPFRTVGGEPHGPDSGVVRRPGGPDRDEAAPGRRHGEHPLSMAGDDAHVVGLGFLTLYGLGRAA